jgi:hypothetical protein
MALMMALTVEFSQTVTLIGPLLMESIFGESQTHSLFQLEALISLWAKVRSTPTIWTQIIIQLKRAQWKKRQKNYWVLVQEYSSCTKALSTR